MSSWKEGNGVEIKLNFYEKNKRREEKEDRDEKGHKY